ncbi:MAG TPA: insulinase family protein [Leeuwenhoekiella sp.]|nr:insulinase family protein [Leeuwenhoekiella sp.]
MKLISIILIILIPKVLYPQQIKTNNDTTNVDNLKTGLLENGLRYAIKNLPEDEGKIKSNLIIKVGSDQEDIGEYELAHLLEHMAYNSTENFPDLRNNTIFFSEFNMEPRDLRAQISNSSTQYSFQYPQSSPTAIDQALSLYYDIASGKVLFQQKSVQAERKALYQELLFSGGVENVYLNGKINSLLTGCNHIPELRNIKSSIMNSSTNALIDFYQKWYSTDEMVITVVGNIKDVNLIERKIRKKFEGLKRLRPKNNQVYCNENYLLGPKRFIVEKRKERSNDTIVPETEFQFFFRNSHLYSKKFSKSESKYLWSLLSDMITNRLKADPASYNKNYRSTLHQSGRVPAEQLYLWTRGDEKKVCEKIFGILQGISDFGFESKEFEIAINSRIENLEHQDYTSSEVWVNALLMSVSNNQKRFNPNRQNIINFFENLDHFQLNEFVKNIDWTPDDIVAILPENKDIQKFNRETINDWINLGLQDPKRYIPESVPETLLSQKTINTLDEAKILYHKSGKLNETILKFENGLKIVLKNQKPKSGAFKNKVMLHGFSPYGASCFESLKINALLSPSIVKNSGFGNYNKMQIDEVLEGTSLRYSIRDYITEWETGLQAEIDSKDLETLLQYIYLSFTAPRYDIDAFQDWKIKELQRLQRLNLFNTNFRDFVDQNSGKMELPRGTLRYKKSMRVDYKDSFEKYKILHDNAANFTFIIVGDFKEKDCISLFQKYLGNLPSKNSEYECSGTVNFKGKSFTNNTRNSQLNFDQETDNKFLSILFRTPLTEQGFDEEVKLEFLKQALNLKLKRLRFVEKLGVYFVAAIGSIDEMVNAKSIEIYLQTNPLDFDEVLETCESIIAELKHQPVSKDFLETVKESSYLPKWSASQSKRNKYIEKRLYEYYNFQRAPVELSEMDDYIKKFSSYDLQQTAKNYFKGSGKSILTSRLND